MICNGVQELGFTQLEHTTLPAGNAGLTLALLAIAEDQQSQKIGSWAVSAVIQEMPESVILEVYCTKYARAMQRLLHQLRFTRHKILVNRLVRFTSRKPA